MPFFVYIHTYVPYVSLMPSELRRGIVSPGTIVIERPQEFLGENNYGMWKSVYQLSQNILNNTIFDIKCPAQQKYLKGISCLIVGAVVVRQALFLKKCFISLGRFYLSAFQWLLLN